MASADEMERAHVGQPRDPGQNRQSKMGRTPIKRTVSKISERTAPKGAHHIIIQNHGGGIHHKNPR